MIIRGLIATYREAFSGLPRRIWLLSAVTLIHRSGTMVVPFLMLYLMTQREMSVRLAGAFLALYGLGSVCGAMIGARLGERFGNVRAMQLTLVGAGLGFFALAWATSPWAIGTLLFVTSIAAEGFRTPSSADLGLSVEPDLRARAYALRRLAINLGMAIGPALGGVLATIDYLWLFVVDGATCLAASVAVALWLEERRVWEPEEATGSRIEVSASRSLSADGVFVAAIGLAVIMNLAFAQLFGTYPLTLHIDFGYSEAIVGGLLAFNTILIVLFEMVLIHRITHLSPLRVVAVGAVVLAAGFLLVPYGSVLLLAFLAMAVMTVGEMLTHPVLEGFVANHVPPAQLGRAMGLLTATFGITVVLAPVAGTAVYDLWGQQVLWVSAAVVTLISAAGLFWLAAREAPMGRRGVESE